MSTLLFLDRFYKWPWRQDQTASRVATLLSQRQTPSRLPLWHRWAVQRLHPVILPKYRQNRSLCRLETAYAQACGHASDWASNPSVFSTFCTNIRRGFCKWGGKQYLSQLARNSVLAQKAFLFGFFTLQFWLVSGRNCKTNIKWQIQWHNAVTGH